MATTKAIENLELLTDAELNELQSRIDSELKKRVSKQRQEAKRQIVELAKSHGIKLDELAGREKVYRNPDNPFGESWNGKGRKPKWLVNGLNAGKKLADFEG